MTCKYFARIPDTTTGYCAIGAYGDGVQVGRSACMACPKYDGPQRGLGDTIAFISGVFGVKPCGGCKQRQKTLNEAVSYV